MSDPTIRIPSCRGDGRCPECGEPGVFSAICGCRPCIVKSCVADHLRALLTEALRRDEARAAIAIIGAGDRAMLDRAEKAEALLREVMGEFPGAHNLVAKIREVLG